MTVTYTTNLKLAKPAFDEVTWHDYINDNQDKIDTVVGVLTGVTSDGAWANNTAYTIGQRIYDLEDSTLWLCETNHTSALANDFSDDRAANPSYWALMDTGITVRGAWVTATAYEVGDLFYSTAENLVALVTVAHTSSAAVRTDAAKWVAIADLNAMIAAAQVDVDAAVAAAQVDVDDAVAAAQVDVDASVAAAAASEAAAATSETNAATSETNAGLSETAAAASELAAATSETNAAASETNAATSETNAATSETNAGVSETNAAASVVSAQAAQTAAESAQTAAELAQTEAETAQTAAEAAQALAEAAASVTNVNRTLQLSVTGGSDPIVTGVVSGADCEVPYNCTIVGVRILSTVTGSIVFDIWKDTYANYPPTNADSITASAPPTLSAGIKSQDVTLTGWTTSLTEGDILRFNVDSVTDCVAVTLILDLEKV